jgi:hypothetical protein
VYVAGIEIDTQRTIRALQIIEKQIPFALSRTINGTMYEAQSILRRELGEHFTVRRPGFLQQSIKVNPTTKANLNGEIGVPPRSNSGIDQALAAQERGGRRPSQHGGKVAEPLSGARPTPLSTTPPSKWPGKLKRTFTVRTAKGVTLILQRVGGKKGRGRRAIVGPVEVQHDPQLRVMYALASPPELKKRWNFVETVVTEAKKIPERFARELLAAIRTAR